MRALSAPTEMEKKEALGRHEATQRTGVTRAKGSSDQRVGREAETVRSRGAWSYECAIMAVLLSSIGRL